MNALPDYADALAAALGAVQDTTHSKMDVERVDLHDASGRVLSEAIVADRDLPPFNRAMMDGYALRFREYAPGHAFIVAGEVPAGADASLCVPPGACVKIATGAPLPDDCDTVIQHEASDRGNPVRFAPERVERGMAVHPRGADAKRGDALLATGTVLAAHHLGIATAAGATQIVVRRPPSACVLTSGDEVMPAATPLAALQPQHIRNSNAPMVCDLLRRFGAAVVQSDHVRDEREATIAAVQHAIHACNIVITIGGVSAGERDHFPAAFDVCGVHRALAGAAIQPGRPVVVGRAPTGAIVIALPGNPVSVLACACLFAWPIMRAMLGLHPSLPWREVALAQAVKPNAHRRAFRPAALQPDGRALVPQWAGSGDLAHTAPTHGLVELPVQSEPVSENARVRFLPWP